MRLYLRSADRRPDPPPLQTNDHTVVWLGIAVWAGMLIAALLLRSRLEEQGRGWWVWTPVVGIALGLYGLYYLRRRDQRRGHPPPQGEAQGRARPSSSAGHAWPGNDR